MWFPMRAEDLGFVERAPVVRVVEAELRTPPAAVFTALVDPSGWPHWFPGVRRATYTTPPPHGVGTIREADVGGTGWTERIVAWDAPRLWAWTVLQATVPFASAQVESFALEPTATGTRVRWTLALEPRLLARLGDPLAARTMRRLFLRAAANLDARLTA
jgi:uncharacterized protein YndB with AHSA1/START domain